MALEYNNYLREVADILEKDHAFKLAIGNASQEDIQSGKVAENLHFLDRNIRSKLDEIKRKEIDRLRIAITQKFELEHCNK